MQCQFQGGRGKLHRRLDWDSDFGGDWDWVLDPLDACVRWLKVFCLCWDPWLFHSKSPRFKHHEKGECAQLDANHLKTTKKSKAHLITHFHPTKTFGVKLACRDRRNWPPEVPSHKIMLWNRHIFRDVWCHFSLQIRHEPCLLERRKFKCGSKLVLCSQKNKRT